VELRMAEKSDIGVSWTKVAPGTMPTRGEPVLIRLVDTKIIKGKGSDHESVLLPGPPYGFQVAVLRYVKDGFENWHPEVFVALGFNSGGGHELRGTYKLNQVSHWARLT